MSELGESHNNPSVAQLQKKIQDFATVRDWSRFHNPKNVAEAIVIEAAELLECFQWRTDAACLVANLDDSTLRAIQSELADVLIYALNLSNVLNVDAAAAIQSKLEENGRRFPVPNSTA